MNTKFADKANRAMQNANNLCSINTAKKLRKYKYWRKQAWKYKLRAICTKGMLIP